MYFPRAYANLIIFTSGATAATVRSMHVGAARARLT